MKKIIALALISLLFLVANQAIAQNLIAVQNGNTPKFYVQVDDALTNALDGDTIYIPGGIWPITKTIAKRLHLVGVGHHPDSTKVTFPTTLNGNITLGTGASNGSLTGLYLSGNITCTPISAVLNYYLVSRCRFVNIILGPACINFNFMENIFFSISCSSATYCSFFNNVISGTVNVGDANGLVLKNNIFLYNYYSSSGSYNLNGKYLIFENNIILDTSTDHMFTVLSNSIFKNNLFVSSPTFPRSTNNGSNNIVNQAQSSIFVNQTGNSFNYAHDYHLKAGSPGKNAGTDGTDIGIYGGFYPWKEGSLPAFPHYQMIEVAPKTDASGNLNVKIKVAAQEN